MKLTPNEFYLVLHHNTPNNRPSVGIETSLNGVLTSWHRTSRVSPIWRINSGLCDLGDGFLKGRWVLIFLGPVRPTKVRDMLGTFVGSCEIWLTIGLYNVVVAVPDDHYERILLPDWAAENHCPFETWRIDNGVVEEAHFHNPNRHDPSTDQTFPVDRDDLTPATLLSVCQTEYLVLMASVKARTADSLPSVYPFCEEINANIKVLKQKVPNHVILSSIWTSVNAGLSRFSSQALSGTSPIALTECHFWTHSLLGTGIANLALHNYITYIIDNLGKKDITGRILSLQHRTKDVPCLVKDINSGIWLEDHIGDTNPMPLTDIPQFSPIVSYFSARDGYKAHHFTISAPLAALSGCNSLCWSLRTLTHEISHIIVRGVLAELCPNCNDDEAITNALELIGNRDRASDWLTALRRYFLHGFIFLNRHRHGNRNTYTRDDLIDALSYWHNTVEELMVHVFDFLYFYNCDHNQYICGIWTSWAVLPYLGDRIREYLLRSLCAVLANNLDQGAAMEHKAFDHVSTEICRLMAQFKNLPNIHLAERMLCNDREELRQQVIDRKVFVKIVRGFLYSKKIAHALHSPQCATTAKAGILDGMDISNPLQFLEDLTDGIEVDACKSAWMLNILATNLVPFGGEIGT